MGTDQETQRLPEAAFAEFLESHPPGQQVFITNLADWSPHVASYILKLPELQLHCSGERCAGTRVFRSADKNFLISDKKNTDSFVVYFCSNCRTQFKTFALKSLHISNESGACVKYGEIPGFGPPTPSRLIKLIGPDRDIFLKGRRCENQGLGIGAFVYYRRVVENQKNRILEEVKRVSEKVSSGPEIISILDQAIKETRFSSALESAKAAIPQSLLVNGHNPLALLHSALSEGVHELNDNECLNIAASVRVILSELAERMAQALKDEAELSNAIGNLLVKKTDAKKSADVKKPAS